MKNLTDAEKKYDGMVCASQVVRYINEYDTGSKGLPINVAVLLDCSGSMQGLLEDVSRLAKCIYHLPFVDATFVKFSNHLLGVSKDPWYMPDYAGGDIGVANKELEKINPDIVVLITDDYLNGGVEHDGRLVKVNMRSFLVTLVNK